jgi:hypothetical protein
MVAVLWFAFVMAAALALLLARYATNPWVARASEVVDPRPRIDAAQLRSLVIELLGRIGVEIVEEELFGEERRFVAVERGSVLHGARYVVFVEPSPPGDMVEQGLILELAEAVKCERGGVGLLFTPYGILRDGLSGLEVSLELIDGMRLRDLVARLLPERLAALQRYRGFGAVTPAVGPGPVAPRPA